MTFQPPFRPDLLFFDHFSEAVRLRECAKDFNSINDTAAAYFNDAAQVHATLAQVQATLALVKP